MDSRINFVMTILTIVTGRVIVILRWGGTGFSAALRVAVIALPSPRSFPTFALFVVMGHHCSKRLREQAGTGAAGANVPPAVQQTPTVPIGLLCGRGRKRRSPRSHPDLALVGHPCRLGTNRRKRWSPCSHPDCAIVFDRGGRNFHGADVFHGSLQYLDPTQCGHTIHSMVMLGC
jgi:hypothetical protein